MELKAPEFFDVGYKDFSDFLLMVMEFAHGRAGEEIFPTLMSWDKSTARLAVMVVPFENERDKRGVAHILGKFREAGYAYALFTEAWMSHQEIDQEKVMPCEDPNRKDVLMIQAHDPEGEDHIVSAPLITEGETRKAGAWESLSHGESRFLGADVPTIDDLRELLKNK